MAQAGHSPVQSVETEPATATALMQIRELIVTGVFAPGERLRAEALATRFAVSRTPIRSALAVLSAEGLVEYSVNQGYTVKDFSIRDVLDAIEARATLEAAASRLAADYGWEFPALQRLKANTQRSRRIVDAGRWSEAIEHDWYTLNVAFHREIQQAARNAIIRNAIRMTIIYPIFGDVARLCPSVARHIPLRLRALPRTVPDHVVHSQDEHESLLQRFVEEDSAGAETEMARHVRRTKERIHAIATRD